MSADLEPRRRAIAEALRAIMAEPLPERQQPPVPVVEPASVATRQLETVDIDDEWGEAELTDPGDEIVPPMETVGTMSRMASLALFGHV